jgi:putative ABC transport system permease protein
VEKKKQPEILTLEDMVSFLKRKWIWIIVLFIVFLGSSIFSVLVLNGVFRERTLVRVNYYIDTNNGVFERVIGTNLRNFVQFRDEQVFQQAIEDYNELKPTSPPLSESDVGLWLNSRGQVLFSYRSRVLELSQLREFAEVHIQELNAKSSSDFDELILRRQDQIARAVESTFELIVGDLDLSSLSSSEVLQAGRDLASVAGDEVRDMIDEYALLESVKGRVNFPWYVVRIDGFADDERYFENVNYINLILGSFFAAIFSAILLEYTSSLCSDERFRKNSMLKLALRNVKRNGRKLLPMFIILSISFFLIFLLNSIIAHIDRGYGLAYRDSVSGDFSLSREDEVDFTVFGAEVLLVGDYIVPPTIDISSPAIVDLRNSALVIESQPILTGAAQLKVDGVNRNVLFFGVQFREYFSFFQDIQVSDEAMHDPDEPGVFLQESMRVELSEQLGIDLDIGSPILLTSTNGSDFSIRELPIIGFYEYPYADSVMENLILIDDRTARSLSGYLIAENWNADFSADTNALFSASVDDLLFAPAPSETDQAEETGTVFDSIGSFFPSTPENDEPGAQSSTTGIDDNGTLWNFLLMRTQPEVRADELIEAVSGFENESDIEFTIKDWKETVGGNVGLISLIRLVLNIGFAVVLSAVISITVNSIILSVFERQSELGTIRALGASKRYMSQLLALEVGMVVLSAVFIGGLLGISSAALINVSDLSINNQYVSALFNGESIRAFIGGEILLQYLLLGIVVYGISLLIPLSTMLRVTPREAISS